MAAPTLPSEMKCVVCYAPGGWIEKARYAGAGSPGVNVDGCPFPRRLPGGNTPPAWSKGGGGACESACSGDLCRRRQVFRRRPVLLGLVYCVPWSVDMGNNYNNNNEFIQVLIPFREWGMASLCSTPCDSWPWVYRRGSEAWKRLVEDGVKQSNSR